MNFIDTYVQAVVKRKSFRLLRFGVGKLFISNLNAARFFLAHLFGLLI